MTERLDEFSLIEWLRRHASVHPRVPLGIGDDTAVVSASKSADALLTVDMLLEGVHFTVPPATPYEVGRKALAVNLSDIAAMAGRPSAAVVSVSLPQNRGMDFAQELHRGIVELAEAYDVALAGGDTNSWDGPLVVSVTLLGETTGNGAVRRSGAKVGDWLLATGEFGGSLQGKHLSFEPRVEEALQLHAAVELHAMIDVSDGLAADVFHILEESGVGAVLYEAAIPVSSAASSTADGRTPLEHALGDGEDFELVLTVSPADGRRLLDQPPFETRLTHIGEIVKAGTFVLEDAGGNRRPLEPTGWRHAL